MAPAKWTLSPARRAAAAICVAEALVMAVFGVFYLTQLARGQVDDQTQVLTEAVLILLFAVGAGALGRLWLGRSRWPITPTVVWHVLLVPVTIGMFQSGQFVIGTVLALVIVAAAAASVTAAREPERTDGGAAHTATAGSDEADEASAPS